MSDSKKLKYDSQGNIRPFIKRPFVEDMSSEEKENEMLRSQRIVESSSIANSKYLKSISGWMTFVGVLVLICLIIYVVGLLAII